MNLLKIFTYGGIIEVFVVPHIWPCVMGFIPSHIKDTIQIGITLLTSLFPHVTINVQSEVFLKVWNDGDDTPDFNQPITDTKSDSSSDESPSFGGGISSLKECAAPGKYHLPRTEDTTNTTSKPTHSRQNDPCAHPCKNLKDLTIVTKNLDLTRSPLRQRCSRHPKSSASRSKALDDSAKTERQFYNSIYGEILNSKALSERSETFTRSCSAEYQIKTQNVNEKVEGLAQLSGTSSTGYEAPYAVDEQRKYPSFSKSCSVEYATSLEPNEKIGEEKPSTGGQTTENSRSFREIKTEKSAEIPKDHFDVNHIFSKTPPTNAGQTDNLVKPVYFGDNFQNL